MEPNPDAWSRIRRLFRTEEAEGDEAGYVEGEVYLVTALGEEGGSAADAIAAECARMGLNVVRDRDVDADAHPLGLPSVQASERAEFVIVDISQPHPSVLIQLGIACGIGAEANDLLLVAREGSPDAGDLTPFTRHTFRTIEELRRIVALHLPAMRAYHESVP